MSDIYLSDEFFDEIPDDYENPPLVPRLTVKQFDAETDVSEMPDAKLLLAHAELKSLKKEFESDRDLSDWKMHSSWAYEEVIDKLPDVRSELRKRGLPIQQSGFELTQWQKEKMFITIRQAVMEGRIPPVKVRPLRDGSLIIMPADTENVAGMEVPLSQIVELEEMQ